MMMVGDSVLMFLKMMNLFWCNSDGDRQKIHWVSWDCLCVPKKYNGMGFHNLYCFNLALLGKQGRRFLTLIESLLFRIFKAKYFLNEGFLDSLEGKVLLFGRVL
ncbi:hypothetical protein ES288_A03G135700v1 [Gossypium darwinii]|uniref:Reverse transcriptase zinc-binding domain-containing protein n=1 Tax=Gossypium darwinii TaxID=34276 RepID=A0A5D2H539_GOSDA|nr:hypothetical protein ES288_A03G135700v1 [Gossypium darwinii]